MTVAELIEELQRLPGDSSLRIVMIEAFGDWHRVTDVTTDFAYAVIKTDAIGEVGLE